MPELTPKKKFVAFESVKPLCNSFINAMIIFPYCPDCPNSPQLQIPVNILIDKCWCCCHFPQNISHKDVCRRGKNKLICYKKNSWTLQLSTLLLSSNIILCGLMVYFLFLSIFHCDMFGNINNSMKYNKFYPKQHYENKLTKNIRPTDI